MSTSTAPVNCMQAFVLRNQGQSFIDLVVTDELGKKYRGRTAALVKGKVPFTYVGGVQCKIRKSPIGLSVQYGDAVIELEKKARSFFGWMTVINRAGDETISPDVLDDLLLDDNDAPI